VGAGATDVCLGVGATVVCWLLGGCAEVVCGTSDVGCLLVVGTDVLGADGVPDGALDGVDGTSGLFDGVAGVVSVGGVDGVVTSGCVLGVDRPGVTGVVEPDCGFCGMGGLNGGGTKIGGGRQPGNGMKIGTGIGILGSGTKPGTGAGAGAT
jgi:hypothetical protein